MIHTNINEQLYVLPESIEVENASDVIDIMHYNDILIIDLLKYIGWELPALQKAARHLDIEYIPFTTTGAGLLHIFKKMETTEQREFLSLITDSIISYYKSDLTLAYPSDIL